MRPLTISTCMAPNMEFLCRDLAGYLAEQLGEPVQPVLDIPWQERERLLDQGEIDLCWICGLPYVRKMDRNPKSPVPLVAPVMIGLRYCDLPVYFSDVIVHRDSPYQQFLDLRGASWAYNEPNSHSGYGVVLYTLAQLGETMEFFGNVTASGAHQTSLEMILEREVDASAIDSTVLEMELSPHPEIASQIHTIASFGPSPMPPWVVSQSVPSRMRSALFDILTGMDSDPHGQEIIHRAKMARFAAVQDSDYDPIRRMARIAISALPYSPSREME